MMRRESHLVLLPWMQSHNRCQHSATVENRNTVDSQQNDNKTSTSVSGDGIQMSIVNQPVHINHVSVSIKLCSFHKNCPQEEFPQSNFPPSSPNLKEMDVYRVIKFFQLKENISSSRKKIKGECSVFLKKKIYYG